MAEKVRLDLLLFQKGMAESREKARAMIMSGLVDVDRVKVEKPGTPVSPLSNLFLRTPYPPYVSRGGLKLQEALDTFCVDVKSKVILDVGASTGGFTDCLLQRGAAKVIAVDVGYGQLHWKLRQDARVVVLERTNIRRLEPGELKEELDGAVIDVSFISLKLVVPAASRLLKPHAFVIALVKPQFEVGKGRVGKGGVVRDPVLHRELMEEMNRFFRNLGWEVGGQTPSPLLGPKGNKEFLIHLRR
ncbi:MAG: TlyA family RNA methyltransferase [Deltaproteobacteria bacterium]|nr:TlyA family RNA methyltransferase [Deltaproteobacteria bacterium]